MLTTLVDKLSSLGSKHFIVGAFVPVLVFAFLNGVLLYLEFDWFHNWADPQISGASRAFDVAAVGVGLAVVAYVLWSLNPLLIQVLEGRRFRTGSRLCNWLSAMQFRRAKDLRKRYFANRDVAITMTRAEPRWTQTLTNAGIEGLKKKDASGEYVDNNVNTYNGKDGDAAAKIMRLRELREHAEDIPLDDIWHTVEALAQVLRTNSLQAPGDNAELLSADQRDLLTLIEYAKYRWIAREVALANQLQWRFGNHEVAPTAFGNVAVALQNYGLTRYGINLPTFWSRLQSILQGEKGLSDSVQDAKSQLDFHVSCCWLAIFTTVLWFPILVTWGSSPIRFFMTMIAGPVVARLSYLAAVENYIAFGEIVRSSVDLHRHRLFEALRLRRPTNLSDERRMWNALQRIVAFGQEAVDIGYHHPENKK